ncbi:PIG-L family deacetylase [Paenibacillus soyae]|uniref:PIG-L family deacetylase n=1 Tax=Paenibacillus soyae TaxID=2969249 RepID=A0A9X2MQT1_9BACL|nr:PIG-L family deacetylase [Paenibacillus soyae]MCR2805149.1 PIG-L family deacetylase [Paenibacillus soyae]
MNTPDKTKQRKLLAVFAHPDDETFICGGTLAKYGSAGVEMTLVSATRGEMGRRMGNPPYLNRETMPAAREQELRQACEILGISRLQFFDIRDKTVEFHDAAELEARIGAIIDELQPDVVLTFHETLGGHPDHCAIGKATKAAYMRSGLEGGLYYISFGSTMAKPERSGYTRQDIVKIDVSKHKRTKLDAFRAHRCQTEIDEWVWLPDHEAMSYFGDYEYFIVGDGRAPRRSPVDLF